MTESDENHPPPSGDEPPTNIKRHLLFGLALALAFGSIYTGVLDGGPVLQWALGGAALVVVLLALATNSRPSR